MSDNTKDELLQKGLNMMDTVYGPGVAEMSKPAADTPFVGETIRHLFGEIWSRPGLSVRDRRLLVLGATAMLGRADLIEIQVRGAILNNELSNEELEEAALQLAFYAGWGNTTTVWGGIQAAIKKIAEEKASEK
ncbi:MAG: carboxymuconolactone decarboxylase family protein [Spongiibacteraceae bacterium]